MVDTSIIMSAARQPVVDLPSILQRSAESAAAIEQLPLQKEEMQLRNQQRQNNIDEEEVNNSVRKAGLIYNYATQLKELPMEQRRTFLATLPEETLTDIGFDVNKMQSMPIDDASIGAVISQLEPIVRGSQERISARRSESLAGGRIMAQELSDGTVRYLEYGEEIPADQVRSRVSQAQQEFNTEQRNLSASRRGGALGAEEDFKPRITEKVTQAKKESEGEESRAQGVIDAGVSASYQLPTLKRTIDLLNEIETGGFDNVALRIKQTFGVEGANEGELSANLGKAVLSQLRDTFGAAFTQAEGDRLNRIEANYGKNAETNKRLLKNTLALAERKVESALKRAKSRGDDETVAELEDNMSYLLNPGSADKQTKKVLRYNPETGLLE